MGSIYQRNLQVITDRLVAVIGMILQSGKPILAVRGLVPHLIRVKIPEPVLLLLGYFTN
jgi:hypothetical protein